MDPSLKFLKYWTSSAFPPIHMLSGTCTCFNHIDRTHPCLALHAVQIPLSCCRSQQQLPYLETFQNNHRHHPLHEKKMTRQDKFKRRLMTFRNLTVADAVNISPDGFYRNWRIRARICGNDLYQQNEGGFFHYELRWFCC